MDPIAESRRLYRWEGMTLSEETEADPSIRQLEEIRLREGLAFQSQPEETRQFLRDQAASIGASLMDSKGELRFRLPDPILWPSNAEDPIVLRIPPEYRVQTLAGFLNRLPGKDIRSTLRLRFSQLENSGYDAVRLAAGLLRFAVVRRIVHDLVDEENMAPARLAGESDAEEIIRRLRSTLSLLHQAVALAPYMYADEEYRYKRGVLLTRLVSGGHALAHRRGREIVAKIERRWRAGELDRGLSLSLPYFDDRALEMKLYDFEVIPAGRTMFLPAFVVLAARREQENVAQRESLSPSTRMHLVAELKGLEQAFDRPSE
jgi:hypothetical protein